MDAQSLNFKCLSDVNKIQDNEIQEIAKKSRGDIEERKNNLTIEVN